jgi:hypothetical protein
VLTALLNEIKSDPVWLNNEKLRFETLLWGGDEIIWVVPAWKGWWTLARFYKHVVETPWEFPPGKTLTLAAGLVFCHHNAPIHRIMRLAKTLGDLAKHDRNRNLAAYQILETFDHAGPDVEAFRANRCPPGTSPPGLLLNGDAMMQAIGSVTNLKKVLPKRRLQHLVQDLYKEISPPAKPWEDLGETMVSLLSSIRTCFGESNAAWLHLLDLWDYIGMEEPDEGGVDVSS